MNQMLFDKDYMYGTYQKKYYEQIKDWDDEKIGEYDEDYYEELNCYIADLKKHILE